MVFKSNPSAAVPKTKGIEVGPQKRAHAWSCPAGSFITVVEQTDAPSGKTSGPTMKELQLDIPIGESSRSRTPCTSCDEHKLEVLDVSPSIAQVGAGVGAWVGAYVCLNSIYLSVY